METKQTPEEKAKEYYKISDLNLEAKVGTDTFQRYLGFVDGYKSLSTEIERLKNVTKRMHKNYLSLNKDCDSMAERNRFLEEGLRDLIDDKFSNREYIPRKQRIERLLSNQNNKK